MGSHLRPYKKPYPQSSPLLSHSAQLCLPVFRKHPHQYLSFLLSPLFLSDTSHGVDMLSDVMGFLTLPLKLPPYYTVMNGPLLSIR